MSPSGLDPPGYLKYLKGVEIQEGGYKKLFLTDAKINIDMLVLEAIIYCVL